MSEYQFYLANLDRKRKDALTGSDAISYFDLCEELGIEPENQELYDSGRAEKISNLEEKTSVGKQVSTGPDYSGFLREARSFGVRTGDLSADSRFKRTSLEKYFPGKFGEDARQNLKNYSPAQIGVIYKRVLTTAKKKASDK